MHERHSSMPRRPRFLLQTAAHSEYSTWLVRSIVSPTCSPNEDVFKARNDSCDTSGEQIRWPMDAKCYTTDYIGLYEKKNLNDMQN